ncbi:hypothetical protein HDU98_002238 [Podochytrium sp. JEL0797]|nr:hypothetical protein HDU98_002238 [Podochytrium sp. JEL0797]
MEKQDLLPTSATSTPALPHSRCPLGKSRCVRILLTIAAVGLAAAWFLPQCMHKHRKSPSDVCPFEQPDLSTPIFLSTRPRLFKILDDSLPEPHTLLLPVAPQVLQSESDNDFPGWKQTANVRYLMGDFTIDGGVIALSRKASTDNSTLSEDLYDMTVYLPLQTERESVFLGAFPSREQIMAEFQVQNVFSVAELPSHLSALKLEQILSTVAPDVLFKSLPQTVIAEFAEQHVDIQFSFEAQQAFWNSRFVKTDQEFVRLTFASRLAAWVHQRISKLIANSKVITEIELMTEFVRLSALCGGDLQSYPPIVGAGPNAAVLHYRTGLYRGLAHKPIQDNTFVLVDAAAEFAGYASDLTRTYARHNKWNKQMKEVYGIVSRVQEKFVQKHYQLDADWAAINRLAALDLTEELVHAGFILGTVEEALEKGVANAVFMPHGLGHPVGLDVHDPTPASFIGSVSDAAFVPGEGVDEFFAWSKQTRPALFDAALANFKVFKGHVCTVEPGVYFIPNLLEKVKEGPLSKFVNWSKIEEGDYVNTVGGVRIEDVVLFDHSGKKRVITRE